MTAISIPDLPKLIVAGAAGYKYVFEYRNHWDKEKQRAVRRKGDTKSVGKCVPVEGVENCGELFFNDEFKQRFPELNNLRVFRYKGGRLEFKPLEGDESRANPPSGDVGRAPGGKETCRLHAGASWSLVRIMESSPVVGALCEAFPECGDRAKILSLASFLTLVRGGSLCDCEEFAECTWMPCRSALTGGEISRFLRQIDRRKIGSFFESLAKECRRTWRGKMNGRRFVALDSAPASVGSCAPAAGCEYANEALSGLPQASILLVADWETGVPVFFRNFRGQAPDAADIGNAFAEMKDAGFGKVDLVLVTGRATGARQYCSELLGNGIGFVCNAGIEDDEELCRLVDGNFARLLDWNNTDRYLNRSCLTVRMEWARDCSPTAAKESQSTAKPDWFAHILYNKDEHDEAQESLRCRLVAAVEAYNANGGKVSCEEQKLVEAFADTSEGRAVIDMGKVEAGLRHSGVRVLLSNMIDSAAECFCAYEERNRLAHDFGTIASRLNCRRCLVCSAESLDAKLFIRTVATAMGMMVRARIRKYAMSAVASGGSYRVHFDSDGKLLAKLGNVCAAKSGDEWVFDGVSGKRGELFGILGLPVPSVEPDIGGEDGDPAKEDDDCLDGLLGAKVPWEDL